MKASQPGDGSNDGGECTCVQRQSDLEVQSNTAILVDKRTKDNRVVYNVDAAIHPMSSEDYGTSAYEHN